METSITMATDSKDKEPDMTSTSSDVPDFGDENGKLTSSDDSSLSDSGKSCCYMPRRYVHVLLLFLGMLIAHAQRVNLAVTVVTILDKQPHTIVGSYESMMSLPSVIWTPQMIGFLHAVFYIGYILTQLPGGYLAQTLPAHRLFGGSIMLSCALNLLLPVAIDKIGYNLTCVVRALQGVSEGLLFPSCYAVMRFWCVPEERSRMGAAVITGVYLGPVLGLIASGFITHYYGWMYVYYVHGVLGMIWYVFWMFLSHEKPEHHPGIREDELQMILKTQGLTAKHYSNVKIPWGSIFCSMPVHALNVANFARSFIFFLLLTNEPAYLNVFGYNLAENGLWSSLPHLLMAVVALFSGPIADVLISDPMLTTSHVRKMFTCLGFGFESICLFLLGVIREGTVALIFLTLGVGLSGFTISGWQINHLDIAPRYASILVAITTAVGTLAGIIMPIIVGELTHDQSMEGWHNVFFLTASILLFAAIFYGIFGTGEKQPWADPPPEQQVQIVNNTSPLDKQNKPYGTFPAQQEADTEDAETETQQ